MKNNFSLSKFIIAVILIFILFDFFIGKYVYNKFVRDGFVDTDINFGLKDEIYDHKFKKSYRAIVGWGNIRFDFCTDANGFRSSCLNQFDKTKTFDIAFIGDSFTEPVGISFEKSFVFSALFSQIRNSVCCFKHSKFGFGMYIFLLFILFLLN